MKSLLPVLVLCALPALAPAAIIIPGLVSSANANTDTAIGAGIPQLTDNSGLSANVSAGGSLASAMAVSHVLNGPGYQQSWVTQGAAPDYFATKAPPTFVWDVGVGVVLANLVVWVYGNDGGGATSRGNQAKSLELRFNTEAQGSATFGGAALPLTIAPDTTVIGTSLPQSFALGGVSARYVQMIVTDNYAATAPMTAGGDRVGIGEIRFNSTQVPEPSALGLLAAACLLPLRRFRAGC